MQAPAELEKALGKPLTRMKVFERQDKAFAAFHAAEEFCRELGFSVGSMQRSAPIGLKRGNYSIAKWRNLDADDRRTLDGVIVGDSKRHGPVTVYYCEE